METITDKNFNAKVGRGLTMVMFTADFCGPCNLAQPTFKEFGEHNPDVKCFTFDLDGNPDIPQKYGVRQIPLFVLFEDGKPKDVVAGAIPVARLNQTVEG